MEEKKVHFQGFPAVRAPALKAHTRTKLSRDSPQGGTAMSIYEVLPTCVAAPLPPAFSHSLLTVSHGLIVSATLAGEKTEAETVQ